MQQERERRAVAQGLERVECRHLQAPQVEMQRGNRGKTWPAGGLKAGQWRLLTRALSLSPLTQLYHRSLCRSTINLNEAAAPVQSAASVWSGNYRRFDCEAAIDQSPISNTWLAVV